MILSESSANARATQPLSLAELAACFGIGSLVFVAVELEKFARRRAAG